MLTEKERGCGGTLTGGRQQSDALRYGSCNRSRTTASRHLHEDKKDRGSQLGQHRRKKQQRHATHRCHSGRRAVLSGPAWGGLVGRSCYWKEER
jgi:hypothetical protein